MKEKSIKKIIEIYKNLTANGFKLKDTVGNEFVTAEAFLARKSFLLIPHNASFTFAPILVPLLPI